MQVHDLFDVTLNELSLVDRPANPEARILLLKRDLSDSSQEELSMSNPTVPSDQVTKTDVPAPATPDTPTAQATPTDVAKANPETASAPDLSAIEAHLAKADARMDELLTSLTEKNALIEKMQAENTKLKADNEKLKAGGVKKADTAEALDNVLKSVPEAVQKAMDALSARVEKAESESRRYAEQIEKAEWTKKAEPLVGCLSIAADALGGLLQRVSKGQSTADDAAELERVFKAVNAAAGQHQTLFREIGKAEGGTVTVTQRIDALATDIRKADTHLTQEQAVAKVLTLHPELYVDYLAETRAQKGA